jgi:hypothetical protein
VERVDAIIAMCIKMKFVKKDFCIGNGRVFGSSFIWQAVSKPCSNMLGKDGHRMQLTYLNYSKPKRSPNQSRKEFSCGGF